MRANNNRQIVVKGIFLFVAFIFLCKFFYIQVVNDQYKFSAKNNVLRYDVKYPARGLLYDRNNKLLAYNEASYDLMIVPREVADRVVGGRQLRLGRRRAHARRRPQQRRGSRRHVGACASRAPVFDMRYLTRVCTGPSRRYGRRLFHELCKDGRSERRH